jgi:hypothetical protein
MDGSRFDHLARLAATCSRRSVIAALALATISYRLPLAHDARAQLTGVVVLGAECAETAECAQRDMQLGAMCADNGFVSDGPINCCLHEGCCQSDAQCCGDLRCAPTADACRTCRMPPFPTRQVGQLCAHDGDCVPVPGAEVACVDGRCTCLTGSQCAFFGNLPVPDVPEAETAMAAAARIAELEAAGRFDEMYDLMHPHAQAIIPREVVVGWYDADFVNSPVPSAPVKLRFVSWTWEVTGQTYPGAAEVVMRQRNSDGTTDDSMRLMTDGTGGWRWFFGRDRDFLNEQIARFVGQDG